MVYDRSVILLAAVDGNSHLAEFEVSKKGMFLLTLYIITTHMKVHFALISPRKQD